jgi:hypothetical protein
MPFSQQTYTGQGIVQPTERSRVGEFLGAGLAGLGQSIGRGIEKFAERKEEMKKREQFKKGTITALTALGADADLLKGMEATELAAYAQMYPEIVAQQQREEAQGFYSEMLTAYQPQQVERDFGPQISAAERRLQEAERAGFRPEFAFPSKPIGRTTEERFRARAFAEQYDPDRVPIMSMQDTFAPSKPSGRSEEIQMREEMQAMRRGGRFIPSQIADTKTPSPAPQPQIPMGPEPALEPSPEVQQAARDLEAIRIQAAEGDTRLETSQEVMRRVSESIPELAQKYPTQAKNLYEMLYPKQDKLTPSEQIAMMKLQREVQASEVAGYGVAPSVQIAQDFREFAIPTQEGIEKIQELIDIAKQGFVGKLSPENRNRATSIQKRLMGELKEQIVGAGAVSEGEWQILASVIPDVTKIMSFSDVNIKVLKELQSDLKGKLKNRANAISWAPLQGTTGQAQRPMGRTVSYGMSGKPVMQ